MLKPTVLLAAGAAHRASMAGARAARGHPPRSIAPMLRRAAKIILWRTLAAVAVLLGFIGIFVPGLPTVPFLLLAAWAGGHGWPQLEQWLLNHPRHGPAIRRWRDHGAVPRRAKWAATGMMTLSAALMGLSPAPLAAKSGVPLVMAAVALWLWRRPEV